MINPGYEPTGRIDAAFDGEELLYLHEGVIVRGDARRAERARIPLASVGSFALLADRSLVAVTADGGFTHHVVHDKVAGKQETYGEQVRPAASATGFWSLSGGDWVARTPVGATRRPPGLYLPDNSYRETAETLADGTLVIANLWGILHVDQAVTKYAWKDAPKHLCRGPELMTLWANIGYDKLVLLKLAGDAATAGKTYTMPRGDRLIHLTSSGPLAAGIVARSVRADHASFSLVVWDAKQERLRVALDDDQHVGHAAVMSETRVAALVGGAGGATVRMFDLKTAAPL